jgi:hypothetical protein
MASFVDTAESQAALIRIIKNSESELYIISPYTKISGQTKEYIKNIDKTAINFKIISRMENKSDTNVPESDIQFLKELKNAKILVCQNLHAKCYLNEKEGLITSLNLHEHSQTSNWEMGINFSKDRDPEIYNAVIKEIKHLEERSVQNPKVRKENSSPIQKNTTKQPLHPSWYIPPIKTVKGPSNKPEVPPDKGIVKNLVSSVFDSFFEPGKGYCIRCGMKMEQNPNKPLCEKCYSIWTKYSDPDYQEKYCHVCGKESNQTYTKPVCYDCYKKYYK